MAAYSFPDRYILAGLQPRPEIIRFRQEASDKLRKELDTKRAVDLVRLYFHLSTRVPSWFLDAFVEADASFSTVENEREIAVLADCLLAAGLEDGVVGAGLAVLAAAANGNRSLYLERSNLIYDARESLRVLSVNIPDSHPVDFEKIRVSTKSKGSEVAAALSQQQDFNKAGELLKQVSDNALNETNVLAKQVRNVLLPMLQRLENLEEEVSMLWWYVGGWSKILERPFSDLDPALASAMAGIDLAVLTVHAPGPVAAPAILSRLLTPVRKSKSSKVSIQDMVEAFPSEHHDKLKLGSALKDVAELCPALTGFRLAAEYGGSAWQGAFFKAAGLPADISFSPVELAIQVYREALLVSLLDG